MAFFFITEVMWLTSAFDPLILNELSLLWTSKEIKDFEAALKANGPDIDKLTEAVPKRTK